MAGLLDGLLGGGGDEIKPVEVPLDPVTNQMIDENVLASRVSVPDIAARNLAGTSEAAYGQLASPEQFARQQTAFGMEGTGQALQARYSQQVGDDLSRLSTATQYEAQIERAHKLSKAQNYLKARQNIKTQAYARQMQAYQASQAARASVISSILGVAGTVGGAMIAGPAGAAIGGSVATAMQPRRPAFQQGSLGTNTQLPDYDVGGSYG